MTVPAGIYLARCYRIIDVGTQRTEHMGRIKYLPEVMMEFEVHGHDDNGQPLINADGRPHSIDKSFILTLSEESSLRKDLKTWRGKDFTDQELKTFQIKKFLGAWAMISVVHLESKGATCAEIASILPVPANIKKLGLPAAINPTQMYTIEEDNKKTFDSLSDSVKSRIMESAEWQDKNNGISEDILV